MATDGGLSGDLKFALGIIILLVAAMWADMKSEIKWCKERIMELLKGKK